MESSAESGEEPHARIRQQEVVAELGQQALETDDLDQLMHDASVAVADALDNDYCKVLELLPDGNEVFLRQGVGWREGLVGNATVPADLDSQAGYTLLSEEPIIVDDLRTEDRFSGPELLTSHDVVSGISVIIGSVEEPWGVLGTHTTERREFTEVDATFVQNVANVLAAAIDRTAKEQRLEQYKEYTNDILAAVDDIFYVVDEAGNFQRWNQSLNAVTGYSDAEIASMEPLEFIVEEDREAIANGIEEIFETGSARVEAGVLTKDGTEIPYEFVASRLENPNGEPVLAGIGRNITERKDRERALTKYETIVETINDGIYVKDDENRFTMVNEAYAELTGYDRDQLVGAHASLVVDEDTTEQARARRETPIDGDETSPTMEAMIETADGDHVPAEGTFATIQTDDGEIEQIGVVRDITERREHQRKLEESERRYRTLAEHFPDGAVGIYDHDLRYTLTEGRVLGDRLPSADQLEGDRVPEIFPGDTVNDLEPLFRHAVEEGETDSTTTEFGGRHWRVWAAPIRDADGDIFAGLSFCQDVTDQVEREQHLERYETIVETVNDGVYVVDEDSTFQMVNEAYAQMLGYVPDDLVGTNAATLADDVAIEEFRELLAATVEDDVEQPSMEAKLRTASGERLPVEAMFAPLPEGDDSDWERVGVVRDISDRKERERALKESEHRYRTLVENFPNGAVGLFDEDLRYTAVGGELLGVTGVDPEDRIGDHVSDIYPDELVDEIEPYFHAALEGEANSFETEFHDRHLFAHTLPVRNADDEVYAGMLVVQDVTERREYQRQLEESNERLEQFAYAASHDLQEPLRMVSSYLTLIEGRYADELDEEGEEFLEFAVDGADRMRDMIEGLLEYSRVETAGEPFEPVDLDAVLEDVRENLHVRIEESDAQITTDSLPSIEGDEGQLRQVFQNLLSNAIEYSGDEPPQVHVSAERNGTEWTVAVSDEGIGIDPDDQERIFEVFQRGHSTEESSGTGIGLALCKRIIERHGSDIGLESDPGEGAAFSFTLPAVQEESDD